MFCKDLNRCRVNRPCADCGKFLGEELVGRLNERFTQPDGKRAWRVGAFLCLQCFKVNPAPVWSEQVQTDVLTKEI